MDDIAYFRVVTNTGKRNGNKTWQCKRCQQSFAGGEVKAIAHAGKHEGCGVSKCKKDYTPEEKTALENLWTAKNASLTLKRSRKDDSETLIFTDILMYLKHSITWRTFSMERTQMLSAMQSLKYSLRGNS